MTSGGGSHGEPPGLGRMTLQQVALAVFVGLAIAIALVAVVALWLPDKANTISTTLTVLLTAALACAVLAWLNEANARVLGRGLKHILTIQRASVASFVVSGVAAIGVAIFVAIFSLFAGGRPISAPSEPVLPLETEPAPATPPVETAPATEPTQPPP